MVFEFLSLVSGLIIKTISGLGYLGVFFLMAIESANIPLPSEVIMPFAGYLVFAGRFHLFWAAFWGALGCLFGSVLSYYIGFFGGRPLIERYGKFLLISRRDLERASLWFAKYGEWAIFFSRLLPVIRTYISFPAGIARMNFLRFCLYSFAGSFLWTLVFTYLGLKLGENWMVIKESLKQFDLLVIVIIILGIGWYVWQHIKNSRSDG